MDDIDRLSRWVWLSLACGPGSSAPELLIAAFGDIDAIYEATEDDFAELDIKLQCLTQLCSKSLDPALRIVKWCEMKKVGIITPDDPRYPERLYSIHAFPAVLYCYGRIPEIDKRLCVACVGTRRMTEYGRQNAYAISRDLAKEGAVIVSGLALGIDSVCHRAALDVNGTTIAVLGCGLDRAYPPQNRNLMVEIAKKGTILTEFAPFTEPLKANFPMRNRIISGISNATMVFEADEKSGSLITARHSMKQGRPVYALPGNIGNLSSLGTNELLTNGAFAATKAGDIIADFEQYISNGMHSDPNKAPKLRSAPAKVMRGEFEAVPENYGAAAENKDVPEKPAQAKAEKEPPKAEPTVKEKKDAVRLPKEKAEATVAALSVIETKVYNALSRTSPMTCDQLVSTGYPVNKILAALTMLEIKKLIISMPGGGFVRI